MLVARKEWRKVANQIGNEPLSADEWATLRGGLLREVARWKPKAGVDADDVVQEVMKRLAEPGAAECVAAADSPSNYLLKMAENVVSDFGRKDRRERRGKKEYERRIDRQRTWWFDDDETPTDDVSRNERIQQVQRALTTLRRRDREILTLRYFEGRKVVDVARSLGITPGAAAARLMRARQALRKILN